MSLPPEWMEIIDPNYCYKNIEGGRYVSDGDFNINGKRNERKKKTIVGGKFQLPELLLNKEKSKLKL